jgi:hypothetical protein
LGNCAKEIVQIHVLFTVAKTADEHRAYDEIYAVRKTSNGSFEEWLRNRNTK